MLKSMTGYGRGSAELDGRAIVVELRSVNHRYLDLSPRIPRVLLFLEDPLRETLSQRLSRGHVDVYVYYYNTRQDTREVQCNYALLESYSRVAAQAADHCGVKDDTRLYEWLRMPEVLTVQELEEDQDAILSLCDEAVKEAVEQLLAMRAREGARMGLDIAGRVDVLAALRQKIGQRAPIVVKDYREKLRQRIDDLLGGKALLDEGRMENEVAHFADRACIDEELVRLDSHIAEMREMLETAEATGRKLDFLVQELNREMNTIGSKANDAEISRCVVEGKSEIEKIREQVQNIE